MSFENFNTTLMLVGADPPLTVMMYVHVLHDDVRHGQARSHVLAGVVDRHDGGWLSEAADWASRRNRA